MPQKVLKFTGINRKKNEFQDAGACEELINVRPAVYGLEVVKPKLKKFAEADYDVYNHVFGDKSIFVAVSVGSTFSLSIISGGSSLKKIDSFDSSTKDYSISFLANKMLVSHGLNLYLYEYKDDAYVKVETGIPDSFDVSCSIRKGRIYEQYYPTTAEPDSDEFKELASKHWSATATQCIANGEILGPILIALNVSLSDGTEFWTNKWIYINPDMFWAYVRNVIYDNDTFWFESYKVDLTIANIGTSDSEIEKMISSVNIYTSRQIFPYDIDNMYEIATGIVQAPSISMEKAVGSQLMYFNKSIDAATLESEDVQFSLVLEESQAGERVLEVDSGAIKRVGNLTTYNNRVHFYDSKAIICPQKLFCSSYVENDDTNGNTLTADAYVYLECDSQTIVINTRITMRKNTTEDYPSKIYCCYPDARATKILIHTPKVSAGSYCVVNLKQSDRYNFAYGEATYPDDVVTIGNIRESQSYIPETDKINVSAPYNPFVFPVENSYSVGGKIIDLTTSYMPISSTQIGQYPLTVFTTNGIYSLEQGSGGTLYGNILPIQPLASTTKATPTPYGIFFISSRNLYMLTGRDVANASYVLNGDRELNLREDNAYKKLCLNSDDARFNFSKYLSDVNFEDFISNATLTYDELQNELIISSNDESIGYSYVFNLDTKSYHKVSKRYISKDKNARYVVEQDGNYKYVVDLHTEQENDQSILLQSRPFGIEMAYTHIERLLMLVDAKLTGEQNLCISVFGSDNLSDWKCIISSQKHDTVLRHIRTNRAAKSYKDYVILINGKVDTNTDLSELAVDYAVVNRRLA